MGVVCWEQGGAHIKGVVSGGRSKYVVGTKSRAQGASGVFGVCRRCRLAKEIELYRIHSLRVTYFAVVREFCRISMEFIQKGVNVRMYTAAARGLYDQPP